MSMVALEGLRPWILQRITAVYMALYLLYLVIFWSLEPAFTFQVWKHWIINDLNQILLAIFYLSLVMHSWVGIRDILLDYIKPLFLRLVLFCLVALFLLGSILWLFKILMMVK